MAQKVQVILVDDLDGGTAEETVSFALDGVSYEIDLSADNAATMREALAGYVGSARRVGGRSAGGRSGAGRSRRSGEGSGGSGRSGRTAEIRQWAREHGHTVNERGRIPASVVEAYEAAHG
jgi:Lsr2